MRKHRSLPSFLPYHPVRDFRRRRLAGAGRKYGKKDAPGHLTLRGTGKK
jgi:hypothetical protein